MVAALAARYLEHVERDRLYYKHGKPTSERLCIGVALRPLVRLFGSKPAKDFSPLDLVTVRTALCEPLPPPQEGEDKRGRWHVGPIVRGSVNKHLDRVRRLFQWAAAMQLVPASTWHALQAVEGLRRGQSDKVRESEPVKPAEPRAVAKVLRHVKPVVAGLIRFQWLTGCRPGEAVQLRLRDIDRKGKVWVFAPQRHKSEHHGRTREVMVGPKAQRVLAQFFRADPDARLFPISTSGYREAIRDACREAGVDAWAPNQLRHSAATRFRRARGIEAAGTLLGHANVDTTAIYAEQDRRAAMDIAAAIG